MAHSPSWKHCSFDIISLRILNDQLLPGSPYTLHRVFNRTVWGWSNYLSGCGHEGKPSWDDPKDSAWISSEQTVKHKQAKALLCVHCEGCHDLQYLYFELCLTCTKVQLELLRHPSREGGDRLGALLCFCSYKNDVLILGLTAFGILKSFRFEKTSKVTDAFLLAGDLRVFQVQMDEKGNFS